MESSILTQNEKAYQDGVITLADRILVLIPTHPEIMQFRDANQLFKVSGFKCADLGSSYMQANFAMARAHKLYKEQNAR